MQHAAHGTLGFIVVAGDSMWPVLRSGDAVLCEPVAAAVPGEIVVARLPHAVVAHRVVSWTPGAVVLRGDATPLNDAPVAAELVLGRVVRVRRGGVEYRIAELDGAGRALGRARYRLKRALLGVARRLS
jgi:signal peptidase I